MLILRDLMFKGARHYADFLNAGEGISTNILADRLAMLESEGIIIKEPDPDHGARFNYFLSPKGLGLVPAMLEIVNWSESWDPQTEVPADFIAEFRAGSTAMAQDIVDGLEQDRHLPSADRRPPRIR